VRKAACDVDENVLLAFIKNSYSTPEGLTSNSELIRSEIIDSYGIIELIEFLEETFEVQIPDERVDPDSFRNVQAISKLVKSLL